MVILFIVTAHALIPIFILVTFVLLQNSMTKATYRRKLISVPVSRVMLVYHGRETQKQTVGMVPEIRS